MQKTTIQKIYVVEDDDSIRDLLIYALSTGGFETQGFADGKSLHQALNGVTPDLILLDIMLPGEDGIAILKRLKATVKTRKIPVIMLTAKGEEYDRIKGLDSGADDYVTKPFSVMEIISRVRAVLRRSAPEDSRLEIEIGGITLRVDRRSVYTEGKEIVLTYKEFELLHYLMLNDSIVLSRDKIMDQVWGYDYFGGSRTVDMHIKSVRQKLGESGNIIKTIRNVGYKIEGKQ
ncbi:MAG: response regulator transcription factor [Leptospirales bacterium]|nr:response regulator transcription factor [Leptospirales bacterium]